ncbi:unnamed protein product [Larinioides sclopetarius]|uniref:Uncharacterized protein n=1 Tax=Larinioides sclopetarius TaxID=280406 RepID=A0AAV2BI59_9ARAC
MGFAPPSETRGDCCFSMATYMQINPSTSIFRRGGHCSTESDFKLRGGVVACLGRAFQFTCHTRW